MCHLLQAMCLPGIKKRISLPIDWKQETESHFLFSYFIDDRTRFLEVTKDEDGAQFFKENGFIDEYEGTGKFLKMFSVKALPVCGKKGEKMEWVRTTVIEWKHIRIFPSDVIHFAAKNEYQITGSMMGLSSKPKAKIRSINYIQAA